MSVFDFPGYLARPSGAAGLRGELIGFNARTGQPVQAAAGLMAHAAGLRGPDGLGSYSDITPDFYQTFQHENWQHPGSEGWSSANVPGWGNNPNLQMFARRGADGLGTSFYPSEGLGWIHVLAAFSIGMLAGVFGVSSRKR